MTPRDLWIDASAGIAGDMLLGALVDAGASPAAVRAAVDAVLPGEVRLWFEEVTRAGLRATKAHVEPLDAAPPRRTWRSVEGLLARAALADPVRRDAVAVFTRLAEAEARVHGVGVTDVHFHEAGAIDAVADVVGVCAALRDLGAGRVTAGPVALGSGRVRTAHGLLPVPVPAVLEMSRGRWVCHGGEGELATPTGMALLTALARCGDLPVMEVSGTGLGAGTRDTAGRANVVRIVLGTAAAPATVTNTVEACVLEANVDDLDPRLWPGVLDALLDAGASDAWLTPILMKKGRPAHTLSVLAPPGVADPLRELMFRLTTTIGVRETPVRKVALDRGWTDVPVRGAAVAVKVAYRAGRVVRATPEFEEVAALARATGVPEHQVLAEAAAAAAEAGWRADEPLPEPPRGAAPRPERRSSR